ncbi:TRAP transporter large permease [Chelativorans sp. Marseille-P2723]|uniref:TRAP transporter large permease n=1 Tax=Chelativorans sp. Marseille-P2723 TaxID=2709133 RepID=UPI00156EFCC8|nr:TRAP transporter large permease [Chelativorans sp. Marseille-P2723]
MVLLSISILLLLLIGTPIAVAFSLGIFVLGSELKVSLASLSSVPHEAVFSFPLLAIPLFLLIGSIMQSGGLAPKLIRLCETMFGQLRASLGYIFLGASGIFGAITGSSVATVAAIGGIVGGEMRKRDYPRGYVAALNAAAGLLGVFIPPSIPLILYGAAVGVSISQLFIATLVPGLMMLLGFAVVHYFLSRKVLPNGHETASSEVTGTSGAIDGRLGKVRSAGATVPVLLLPVVVLGGIYGGIFTPTEAAAVGCIFAFLLSLFTGQRKPNAIKRALFSASVSSGAILFIIAMTALLNRTLVINQIPQEIAAYASTIVYSQAGFLVLAVLVATIIGMFMETNSAVLLMGPLLAPAAIEFGVDPIHFGIILVTTIEIGLLTPPLAANIFVAAKVNDTPVWELFRYIGWFLAMAYAVLVLIVSVPAFSLWYRYIGM